MSLWVQFNYRRVTRFQSDLSPYWSLLGPLARESLASFHSTRLAFLGCSGDHQQEKDMGGGGGGWGLEIEHQEVQLQRVNEAQSAERKQLPRLWGFIKPQARFISY